MNDPIGLQETHSKLYIWHLLHLMTFPGHLCPDFDQKALDR